MLKGICFEMNDILLAQAAAGIEIGTIRLTGGAAKSPLWCQMLADVFQKPIEFLQTSETGCLGAALYAGIGAGIYSDPADAVARAVKTTTRYEPQAFLADAYDEAFARLSTSTRRSTGACSDRRAPRVCPQKPLLRRETQSQRIVSHELQR